MLQRFVSMDKKFADFHASIHSWLQKSARLLWMRGRVTTSQDIARFSDEPSRFAGSNSPHVEMIPHVKIFTPVSWFIPDAEGSKTTYFERKIISQSIQIKSNESRERRICCGLSAQQEMDLVFGNRGSTYRISS